MRMTQSGRFPLPVAHNVLDEEGGLGKSLGSRFFDDTLVEVSASPSSSNYFSIGIIEIPPIDWDTLNSRVCRSVLTT